MITPGDERSRSASKMDDARQANPDKNDIEDPDRDKERLNPDSATINLPDVQDIPGQQNITVPPLGEISDTTIASDDEEGKEVFGEE
jgi:hypothetical protein